MIRTSFGLIMLAVAPALAQVDQKRAAEYFQEAAALCEREGGRLWGVSLCGPIVFTDAATKTIATNQTPPNVPQPPLLGFANAAMEWGGVRWTTIVWSYVPADAAARGRLMFHELFHRIQPQLGLVVGGSQNEHLDTLEARYWMRLEWRALSQALGTRGADRAAALRDALAFRAARRNAFPGAASNERPEELREGLAQYTGTVVSVSSSAEAVASVQTQLRDSEQAPSFTGTFSYASGAAYGILLDAFDSGWTHRLKPTDDLGSLVQIAAKVEPSADASAAARRYGGADVRAAEEKRDLEQKARIAELRRRFVEGPVLILPPSRSSSSLTPGRVTIPDAGTIYPQFRTSVEWGSLEADAVLIPADRSKVVVPAPAKSEGAVITGNGWTLKLAAGWLIRPGTRAGDFEVVRTPQLP